MSTTPVTLGIRRWTAGREGVPPQLDPPTDGRLIDRYGRVHHDLRISVTDRCNLRCSYCITDDSISFLPRDEVLSFDEIIRVARVARTLGVTSVRLTGGEPLVRKDLPRLVGRLTDLGFDDLALTTNGMLLAPVAAALAAAGLHRVNVSCDSLQSARFSAIRRRGNLETVLRSMTAAEAAGLTPLKVNVVVVRGVNDDEILDFAAFGRSKRRIVRFIEFMPLDSGGAWDMQCLVPGAEIVERISSRYPLVPVVDRDPRAPAQSFRYEDGEGEVGLIASVTQPFCGDCDRLRLTADGAIRSCLFSDNEFDVRTVLRQGGTDDDVAQTMRAAIWGKPAGHQINQPGFVPPIRSMSMIGG